MWGNFRLAFVKAFNRAFIVLSAELPFKQTAHISFLDLGGFVLRNMAFFGS